MAVTAAVSDQLVPDAALRPTDEHGKLRIQYFHYKNLTGAALDDGSTIDLVKLPPGTVRVLPILSRWKISAQGAARVLKTGLRAYRSLAAGPDNAEDSTAFNSAIDVSAALADQKLSNVIKFDIYSLAGVVVFATVTGGTIPINGEIEGYITYVYE